MARTKRTRPDCPFTHFDCFSLMSGKRCFCLDNTDFPAEVKVCPFYKTDEEVDFTIIYQKNKEESET